MNKRKSNSGAAKRFGKTGTGKIKFKHAGARHILTSKSTKRKRKLRACGIMKPADAKRVRELLPYL